VHMMHHHTRAHVGPVGTESHRLQYESHYRQVKILPPPP
jgi:hypothetical protein